MCFSRQWGVSFCRFITCSHSCASRWTKQGAGCRRWPGSGDLRQEGGSGCPLGYFFYSYGSSMNKRNKTHFCGSTAGLDDIIFHDCQIHAVC